MTKAPDGPCKRHKAGEAHTFRVLRAESYGFVMVEWRKCLRCGEQLEPRVARGTIRRSRAESLVAYGLTDQQAQEYLRQNHPGDMAVERVREKLAPAAVEVPLTCWPFKVSASASTRSDG